MTFPKWNDPKLKAGTMIRSALWLISEIGIGNSFTKEKHRQAFSGVSQADRRLRDLRDYGWVIHTNLEDLTLNSSEQRLIKIGQPVWERGIRKHTTTESLTAKKRMLIFAENDYQCVVCGIAGGECYPDAQQMTAVLSISRQTICLPNGQDGQMLVCECKRCRAGSGNSTVDVKSLASNIRNLHMEDLAVFLRWASLGRRNPLDRAWADFRRLSATSKDELLNCLKAD